MHLFCVLGPLVLCGFSYPLSYPEDKMFYVHPEDYVGEITIVHLQNSENDGFRFKAYTDGNYHELSVAVTKESPQAPRQAYARGFLGTPKKPAAEKPAAKKPATQKSVKKIRRKISSLSRNGSLLSRLKPQGHKREGRLALNNRALAAVNPLTAPVHVGSRAAIGRARIVAPQLQEDSFKYSSFYRRVHDQIAAVWLPNVQVAGESVLPGAQQLTRLNIVLSPQGDVLELSVQRSSGSMLLDRVAKGAVQDAQPFANPPRELLSNGQLNLVWDFVVLR